MNDAARLVGEGELVVFGSAALAFWLAEPAQSRTVDLWCQPPARADAVTALMGELSWYHERHGTYVEVWAPETLAAPSDWRSRARTFQPDEAPKVEVIVPHPHDVLIAKLERMDPHDWEHLDRILRERPITAQELDTLAARAPARALPESNERRIRFEANLAQARRRVGGPPA